MFTKWRMWLILMIISVCVCLPLPWLLNSIVTTTTPINLQDAGVATRPHPILDPATCDVKCPTGHPCGYPDTVDLRIMVLAYDRSESLRRCLDSVGHLDTLGARVSVHIWIDRSAEGQIHAETYAAALHFSQLWRGGRACVHNQTAHANIAGQWINTWRPQPGSREVGLILEDDVDISRLAARWLMAMADQYRDRDDVSGYSLQMEHVRFLVEPSRPMFGPPTDSVYLYGILGTWGFSPRPDAWRDFQDWYHSKPDSLRPYVPGIIPTRWYQGFESRNQSASMWEMWHIYHSYIRGLYCVYCNLRAVTGSKHVLLSANRREKGLHFSGNGKRRSHRFLLTQWDKDYDHFPEVVTKYGYNGTVVT